VWTLDESRHLAKILDGSGGLNPVQRDLLEALADQQLLGEIAPGRHRACFDSKSYGPVPTWRHFAAATTFCSSWWGSDSNGEKNNDLQGPMCSVGAACRLPGRLRGGPQQADQGKTSALLRHERPPMMTVGSRVSVSTPQGAGIKPTGHTLAPARRVGLSKFPLATDPVSTAISESLSYFGLAADFCSTS
jgi:hypothetical protein